MFISQFCQFTVSNHPQQVVNFQFEGSQIESFQQHWIVEQHRVDFSDFLSIDDWFPIEVNVPDTVMDIWQGIGSAWTAASEYFSTGME